VTECLRVFCHVGFFVGSSVVGVSLNSFNDRRRLLLERNCAVSMTTEKEYEHIGETRGCADHDHDLVHELSRRLDSVWRYDQYVANADGRADLQNFWRNVKAQEQENVQQLKKLLAAHVQSNCF
jgi:hypothetical protein